MPCHVSGRFCQPAAGRQTPIGFPSTFRLPEENPAPLLRALIRRSNFENHSGPQHKDNIFRALFQFECESARSLTPERRRPVTPVSAMQLLENVCEFYCAAAARLPVVNEPVQASASPEAAGSPS